MGLPGLMELAAGIGIGLVSGFFIFAVGGNWLFRSAMETITDAIDKITYSVAHPTPKTTPVQVPDQETTKLYASLEEDDSPIPDWMTEEFELNG